MLLLLATLVGGSSQGAGIPGVFVAVVGFAFVWLARATARARLEVTPDSIWSFRWVGKPRHVQLSQITRLSPMTRNNYGGVVAHVKHRRVFSANGLMLGYPQLIDYFQERRPDLSVSGTPASRRQG